MTSRSQNKHEYNSEQADIQIEQYKRIVDFDIKEYPIEVIVDKYTKRDPEAKSPEFYVPEYQRDFTWDNKRQSRFIESILIGLPIPLLTFAEVNNEEGQLEIVDGSQRVRTLAEYLNNTLTLEGLDKLMDLNSTCFDQLTLFRQRKFKRSTIRIIVLSKEADEETRRDIFERINTGSDALNEMERRRGVMRGPFIGFLEECAQNPLFNELVHVSEPGLKRREKEELVLRFFAYRNSYLTFGKEVRKFLDAFIDSVQTKQKNGVSVFNKNKRNELKKQFEDMLSFVQKYFPNGFSRKGRATVSRIRFEALSVGASLALEENESIIPRNIEDWIESETFVEYTTSDASNSRPKVKNRIEYVRDMILGRNQ